MVADISDNLSLLKTFVIGEQLRIISVQIE
jgi:hypothetical protein